MLGRLSKTFLLLFIICLIGYIITYGLVLTEIFASVVGGTVLSPAILSFLMMVTGWGAGIFFILFIVMLVLHR